VKPEAPCRKLLRYVRNHMGSMNKNSSQCQIFHVFRPFLLLANR
jgi:hypothetical protein